MSLIARMQQNDRAALDALFAAHGPAFAAFARALGVEASTETLQRIVWEASVLYRAGPSDLAFALAKLAEGLIEEDAPGASPSTSHKLAAGLAARVALGLSDDAEKRALSALCENPAAAAIAARVDQALAAARAK